MSALDAELRFRLIFQAALDAITFIDAETGLIVESNRAASEMYGYSHDEFFGLHCSVLRAPDRRDDVASLLTKVAAGEESRVESIGLRKDGTTFPIEAHIRGIRIDGRSLVVSIIRDATERHQAREQLVAALDEAVRASRLKSNFVATISHEIRTPMNGVIGMTDLLLRTSLDDEQREYAETIQESATALLRIIDDILDFSKIEAGKVELESAAFSVRRLIGVIGSILGAHAQKKSVELLTSVDPSIPSRVRGDGGRLRQVLLNLVGNAIKFTARGSVTLTAESDANDLVRFSIVDTGIGMAPETLERLFRPFTQGDASTTRRYGGTGLGLSISQRLVELMGGKLEVSSRVGEGSRFSFSIPLPEMAVHDTPGALPDVAPHRERSAQSMEPLKMRVLLAEDNAVNQRVAKRQLENLGCSVVVVANGREAVRKTNAEHFDIVLMDCHMPVMDGFSAARSIREREAAGEERLPILALTAGVMDKEKVACIAAGMDEVLSKPIDLDALRSAIERWTMKESAV